MNGRFFVNLDIGVLSIANALECGMKDKPNRHEQTALRKIKIGCDGMLTGEFRATWKIYIEKQKLENNLLKNKKLIAILSNDLGKKFSCFEQFALASSTFRYIHSKPRCIQFFDRSICQDSPIEALLCTFSFNVPATNIPSSKASAINSIRMSH